MTPEKAHEILEVLKKANADVSERLYANLEKHLAASDRQILQLAQLALLEEEDQLQDLNEEFEVVISSDPT